MPRGRPKKPKIIYDVVIYQDNVMKFWNIMLDHEKTITGCSSKDDAINYVNENGWNIKEIRD